MRELRNEGYLNDWDRIGKGREGGWVYGIGVRGDLKAFFCLGWSADFYGISTVVWMDGRMDIRLLDE